MASVRNSENTAISKIFLVIFFIVWGVPFLGGIFSLFTGSNLSAGDVEAVADGFTIDSYKVVMNVGENNVVDVTEKITINWHESGHHGIYKFTPEWYEYTGSDGKTIKRKSNLTNYSALGETYVVDIVKKKPRIKIGDAHIILPLGKKSYTINYNYDMGKDPFKNFDAFIFHAFGDYWGTPIKNASLEIHMPSDFDMNKITFWADKYRENEITSSVNYYIDNNVIYATLSNNYKLTKSLTVDIELPEGYFVGESNNYGNVSLIICLSIIGLAVLAFFRWLRYGKNHNKVAQPVEFYAPENYDAAQIGYIYGKQTSKKLTIALIVQLASKGYLKINESVDKKSRTIVNLYPKHSNKGDVSNYLNAERRTIIVSKVKDSDDSLTKEQKTWMQYLFRNGDTKHVITAFDNFFKESQGLIDSNYIKIESDITDNKIENQEEIENISDQITNKTETLPKLTETEQIVYTSLFLTSDTNDISLDTTFYTVFGKVAASLENELRDKVLDKTARNKKIKTFIWLIIGIVAYYLAWSIIEDMNPSYSFLYTLAFISLFGTSFLTLIMGRKTEYGENITARTLGFRNYIEKAEKNQIEKLVEENPNYFYDILPYAYAMNVSQKWVKNFENIPMPQTSMGNFDYGDMVAFASLSDSVHYPVSTGSGSGSSCGGGCSSCGGGCSSCGGGGSW